MSDLSADDFISDPGSDANESAFPEAGYDVVEFGWQDTRKLQGRRKKAQQVKKAKPGSFETMALSEAVTKGIRRKGYRLPTPIQRKAMPLILQGLDVVGMARTGSGKTAAFVIPMIERLKAHVPCKGCRAVILAPTRELALQTHRVVKELGRFTDLRTAILVGGDSMEAQFAELAAEPDVIVATPGRLMHHLSEIKDFSLRGVEFVVFDEADRLFEMGFAEQLHQILAAMPASRQTLLFSATMPRLLAEFARAGLRDPELVRLDADNKLSPDLALAFFTVRQEDKPAALLFLLREVVPAGQLTIVFVSTRHHVEFFSQLFALEGIVAAAVHGSMDQAARKINIAKFRAGKAPVLVVTDVAARGLDIPLLDNVINYDFPAKPKLFVHRAGRAARAGRSGTAYSLSTREELAYLIDLHLYLSMPLVTSPIRGLKEAAEAVAREVPGSMAAAQVSAAPSLLGAFPQLAIDDNVEHLRGLLESNPDLSSQLRAANNAMRLYVKTRPPAAPESARRAKTFAKEGVHPLLAASLPTDVLGGLEAQPELADITAKLRAYRPAVTVLESEIASARAGQGAGMAATPGMLAAAPHERRVEIMRQKRQAHAQVIQGTKQREALLAEGKELANSSFDSVRKKEYFEVEGEDDDNVGGKGSRKRASKRLRRQSKDVGEEDEANDVEVGNPIPLPGAGPSGRYREQGFYVSHLPSEDPTAERFLSVGGIGDQFREAVLDLGGEDAEEISKQARSAAWHWDKKSKKYVKLQGSDSVKAGKRVTGKHKRTADGPSGAYEKWSKKTKLSIGGGYDAGKSAQLAQAMQGRFRHGGRGWNNPFKATTSADSEGTGSDRNRNKIARELRNADQVRKARKEEARKKEHLQRRKHEANAKAKKGNKGPGKFSGKGGKSFGGPKGGVKKGGFKPKDHSSGGKSKRR